MPILGNYEVILIWMARWCHMENRSPGVAPFQYLYTIVTAECIPLSGSLTKKTLISLQNAMKLRQNQKPKSYTKTLNEKKQPKSALSTRKSWYDLHLRLSNTLAYNASQNLRRFLDAIYNQTTQKEIQQWIEESYWIRECASTPPSHIQYSRRLLHLRRASIFQEAIFETSLYFINISLWLVNGCQKSKRLIRVWTWTKENRGRQFSALVYALAVWQACRRQALVVFWYAVPSYEFMKIAAKNLGKIYEEAAL